MHPGGVNTSLGSQNKAWYSKPLRLILRPFFRSPLKGAESIIYLATKQDDGVTGEYFFNSKIHKSSAYSKNLEEARKLWGLSEKRNPEVMVSGADNAQDIEANLEWPDAIVAGPGMFENYWSEQILYKLLLSISDKGTPTLLDAGALRLLCHKAFSKINLHSEMVLTPHPGEAAEMLRVA